MNKEFVKYEQALALKELGFGEECFAVYYVNKEFTLYSEAWVKFNSEFNGNGVISAPLYQQAFRWFREKNRLHSTIAFTSDSIFAEGGYMFMVDIIEPHKALDNDNTYKTYEGAESACLDKLIEICKTK
jgi:hypothetical protein